MLEQNSKKDCKEFFENWLLDLTFVRQIMSIQIIYEGMNSLLNELGKPLD